MNIIRSIQNRIYEIRGERVMLDFDLAALYEVSTKVLNQAVKRNIKRFPKDFMFRLTPAEWQDMRSQFVTAYETQNSMQSQIVTASQRKRNTNVTPFAFPEQGVAMLQWNSQFRQSNCNEYCHYESLCRNQKDSYSGK
jgi:hypothetical protein